MVCCLILSSRCQENPCVCFSKLCSPHCLLRPRSRAISALLACVFPAYTRHAFNYNLGLDSPLMPHPPTPPTPPLLSPYHYENRRGNTPKRNLYSGYTEVLGGGYSHDHRPPALLLHFDLSANSNACKLIPCFPKFPEFMLRASLRGGDEINIA